MMNAIKKNGESEQEDNNMINRVVLVGRLTKEPELRTTPSGSKVCQYTLAVNRTRKAEGQPDADFINCVSWNKTAELMNQYLSKGALIGIEGRIQTRSYDDNTGRKVYVTEVITDSVQFLESKGNTVQNQNKPQNQSYTEQKTKPQERPVQYAQSLTAMAEQDAIGIDEDMLPF